MTEQLKFKAVIFMVKKNVDFPKFITPLYTCRSVSLDGLRISIISLYCTCYTSLVPTIENLGAPSKSIVEASLSKENGQIVIQTVLLKVNHACQTI